MNDQYNPICEQCGTRPKMDRCGICEECWYAPRSEPFPSENFFYYLHRPYSAHDPNPLESQQAGEGA